jgi:hypothetical protein
MTTGLRTRRLLRNRIVQAAIAAGLVVFAIGLALFEPWKLWVDETVIEALPAAAAPVAAPASAPVEAPASAEAPAEPVVEYRGSLISHEHGTHGTVRVLRLPDGSRVLRLEDLDTSNGPDLKVLLSDAAVKPGRAGWHVFDDGVNRSLGSLKGNKGAQNYPIPAGVDVADFRSVSIWCDRFNVSFGAAELMPAG